MLLRKTLLMTILAAVAVTGCSCTPAEKPPEEPEAPPPPTAAQIRQEITQPLIPLVQTYMVPWRDLKEIPGSARSSAIEQVNAARSRHFSGENGEEGIRMAADFIEEQLRMAYQAEAWPLTFFLYNNLRNVLEQRAQNYVQFAERAQIFLLMPRPTVAGFFEQDGMPIVFLDVFLPEENRTERVHVREGEEFNGMVLVEIKGNNRGAIVEHIETGERLDLDYGPRARG